MKSLGAALFKWFKKCLSISCMIYHFTKSIAHPSVLSYCYRRTAVVDAEINSLPLCDRSWLLLIIYCSLYFSIICLTVFCGSMLLCYFRVWNKTEHKYGKVTSLNETESLGTAQSYDRSGIWGWGWGGVGVSRVVVFRADKFLIASQYAMLLSATFLLVEDFTPPPPISFSQG